MTWYLDNSLFQQQSPISSYTAFTAEMKRVFDHPVRGKDASKRLLSLRQGMRSVAEYSIEFRTLSAESGLNSEALQAAFCNGLNDTLKDELISYPGPSDLESFMALAIRIDICLRERKRERQQRSFTAPPTATAATVPASRPRQGEDDTAQQPPKRDSSPEPMQLGCCMAKTRGTSASHQRPLLPVLW